MVKSGLIVALEYIEVCGLSGLGTLQMPPQFAHMVTQKGKFILTAARLLV